MKIVLAGGAGSLGQRLAANLHAAGHDIAILTRRPRSDFPYRQVLWDGRTVGEWAQELADAVVINLAGELVDRRPTAHNIEVLTQSRVEPTTALALAASQVHIPLWIQMSTLAIYGNGGDAILDESAHPADGPPQMAGVATAWEKAAAAATAQRLITLRTGIVFDRDTPALNRLRGLVQCGLGGRVASGQQWVSWLHIDDFLAIVRFLLTAPSLSGIIHATSPNPVRNAEMMATFRHILRRPVAPPTPESLVKLGAWALRTDPALALIGRRCIPKRLRENGFRFTYPHLEPALADLLKNY